MKPQTPAHVSITCQQCENQFFYAFGENESIEDVKCDKCGKQQMHYTSPHDLTQRYGIKFSKQWISQRPDGMMDSHMNHYKCRITSGRRGFSLYFSQGYGIKEEPSCPGVLDCLASDVSGYDNAGSFEDWALEYGYDTDSRKAEKIYRTVKRQSEQLKRTIGDEAYEELLYHTRRL